MFEPVHGTAPDIFGKGEAAMMLDHLGHAGASKAVEKAIAGGPADADGRLRWIEYHESGGRGSYLRTSLKGLTKPIDKASWADCALHRAMRTFSDRLRGDLWRLTY